ncbi:MAG: chemotaxis protein CheB [Bryobacteraceae bacterium]
MTRPARGRTRVALVADRSAAFRLSAARAIGAGGDWVCETAATILETRDKILLLRPAILVLEAEMPGNENGEFLRRLLQYHPLPVMALARTAPSGRPYAAVLPRDGSDERLAAELARVLRNWAAASVRPASYRIIAFGASTGGPEAVERVLRTMPADGPGVVITQHIPKRFSATLAARLSSVTPMEVREAENGDTIRDGLALVAPGDRHMRVAPAGDRWEVRLDGGPKVWHQRPAADVLFSSIARAAAPHAVGVLLTGMGRDGAAGLRLMREAGCWTIAQDEASCVVFGMPRAAIDAGAACEVVPLERIAAAIGAQARVSGSR